MLTAYSHAKVNLCLEVLGRRPDGFHDIGSIFQTVSLRDRLTFLPRSDGMIVLSCDRKGIPVGKGNLVYRAAQLLRSRLLDSGFMAERPMGATIRIQKRIPAGAGLGGGSSNAATALITLPKLWGVKNLPGVKLKGLAAAIGSDVPFFLTGGTCLVTGRGERVRRLRPLPKLHLVIIFPGRPVSTAWAYSRINSALTKRPKYSKIWVGLVQGRPDARAVSRSMSNDLERPVIPRHPAIGRAKIDLMKAGALNSLMSGSGSSVFGVFPDRASARRAWRQLSRRWPETHLAESVAGIHTTRSNI